MLCQLYLKVGKNGKKISKNATVIKTACHCWKNRQIDQWYRIESPEIDSQKCIQLDQGAKAIWWRKDSLSTNGARTAEHPHAKNMNVGTYFTPFTKN